MGKKLTLEIVKERLKATSVEILSTEYVNASTPLHCRCKICENEWKARSDKLCNSGTGCPECAKLKKGNGNKKYTLDKVKENLKHLPISILSSAYKRSDAKLQCKCNLCNEIFESPYATLRKAKVGCPKCGRSKSSTNQKLSINEVAQKLSALNITLIDSEYKGVHTPLKVRCNKCGYEWAKRIASRSGCPRCSSKLKLTLEQIKERVDKSVEVLSSSYKSRSQKLLWRCKICENEWQATYLNLRNGTKCPRCVVEAKRKRFQFSLEQVKQKVAHLSIEILSDNYINAQTKLECKCKVCNHRWQAPYSTLRVLKYGCPRCAEKAVGENQRLSNDEAFKQIALKHPTIEVLTERFVNTASRMSFRCKVCNTKWQTSYNNLIHAGTGCPTCGRQKAIKARTYTLDELKRLIDESVDLISEYKGINERIQCRCKVCQNEWETLVNVLVHTKSKCPKCARKQTKGEKYMQELFESLGIEFIMNDRKTLPSGKELDFYIPSLKISVEINGEFWHSSAQERIYKNYHLDKTRECEALGIHLFQFWHLNELVKKTEIMESMIKNALKLPQTTRIFARKCEVKRIDSKEGRVFCEQNHIQGGGIASVYFGLFYENKLVSVMSFGKARFNKKVEWELIRFCSLLNHSVVGAGSRLLKHFERECKPKSLISYANRRWASANSNLYQKLGFKFVREAEPNYTYYKENQYDGRMFNRITFQRHKIDKWFGKKFDKKMTEGEILESEGFVRIYDCGNLVYLKEYGEV